MEYDTTSDTKVLEKYDTNSILIYLFFKADLPLPATYSMG